jgi:Trk K+ transport system NAD-binding subunit
VVDIRVQEGSPAAGQPLRDVQFPPEVLISVVIGKQGASVPGGDTVLQVGDEVIAVIPRESDAAVRAIIAGPTEGA